MMAVYYAAGALVWVLARRERHRVRPLAHGETWLRYLCTAIVSAAAVWMAFDLPSRLQSAGDGRLRITFLDVGQGDAALVIFPRGSTLLVDAGGLPGTTTFDIGDRVVGPVLRHAGVRRLDVIALTHGDADHAGGAATVLREFQPADVWEGIPVPPHPLLARLHAAAVSSHVRWANVQRSDSWDIDGVQLQVHHPALPDWERQRVRNDDSIVLELRWGEVSVVLTGDIGRDVEDTIATRMAPARLRVLKVPHHGSNSSSSEPFVRALAPDVAIISVGRANTFGHPAPSVLDRYAAVHASVFRTDRDGAVTVSTDGTALRVDTFLGRTLELKPRKHDGHEYP
ncbi:MAG: ComEC/Rec2 family competence protein [Vicinamibacterales bacterium]